MTTPAQPESKTPRSDAAVSLMCHIPGVELAFARQLETELNEAHARENKLRDVIMDCERQVAEFRHQADADRREIERLKAYLRGTESSHVEACFKLAEEFGHSKFSSEPPLEFVRKQLNAAQQRIKELEQRLHKILVLSHLATFDEKPGFKTKAQINDEINDIAAMSREPKEGEAK